MANKSQYTTTMSDTYSSREESSEVPECKFNIKNSIEMQRNRIEA